MKFLIAGLGSIGRRHLRNLRSLGIDDIILLRSGKSTLPDEELAGYPVVTGIDAALSQRPDAVIVSNPTALHLDIAISAVCAGCHVLIEKPVSHSLDRVDELVEAQQASGSQILVGFQYRFHPCIQTIRRLLADAVIGRVCSFRAAYAEYLPGMHPWEDHRGSYSARSDLGGGVAMTLCHPIDYAHWLLGGVQQIWAFAGRLNDFDIQVEDTVEIGMKFVSGAIGSVHLDYNRKVRDHHLEITGTDGIIRWDEDTNQLLCFDAVQESWRDAFTPGGMNRNRNENPALEDADRNSSQKPAPEDSTRKWREIPAPEGITRNSMFLEEMRHFLEAIRGESSIGVTGLDEYCPSDTLQSDSDHGNTPQSDTSPGCTLEEGIRSLRTTLAALESAKRGELVDLLG